MATFLDKKTLGQLVNFAWAAGLSALITLGAPIVLHEIYAVDEEKAVGIALTIAFLVNFYTVRRYVFSSQGAVFSEFYRFLSISVAFRIGEYILFLILHTLCGLHYLLSVSLILFVSMTLKFVSCRLYVFPHRNQSYHRKPISSMQGDA